MSFELFHLGVMIGDTIGQCENEQIPINERFPHEMITAHNGKRIDIIGKSADGIFSYSYDYKISQRGVILSSGSNLSNYELEKAIYAYFTQGE